MEDVIVTGNRS